MKYLQTATPHKEAAKHLRGLPTVDRETFDALPPEFQHGAFLVSGIRAHDVLQDIRDTIAESAEGADMLDVRKRVEAKLAPYFEGGQARRRALILCRAWSHRAAALGITRQLDNHTAAFPYRKRLSAGDGRVRDSHRAMSGLVFPAASPFWDRHTPPDAHNCRCYVVGVTRRQAERLQADEARRMKLPGNHPEHLLPERAQFMTGALLRSAEGGIINRGMSEQYNVNDEAGSVRWNPREMLMPVAEIQKRYTPDVWENFRKWAESVKPDGKVSLWAKLNAQRGLKVKPVPPVKPVPVPVPVVPVPVVPEPQPVAGERTVEAMLEAMAGELAEVANVRTWQLSREEEKKVLRALNTKALRAVELPAAERGEIKLRPAMKKKAEWSKDPANPGIVWKDKPQASKELVKLAQAGADALARVVAKDFMAKTPVAVNMDRDTRASCQRYGTESRINVNKRTSERTHAHEIAHAVEQWNPEILAAALAFRARRTAGESLQWLGKLTGNNAYARDEMAYEDEWMKRGGSPYAGKEYSGNSATEIITMGVERLLYETAEFAADDPDYFRFMVETLQNLKPQKGNP